MPNADGTGPWWTKHNQANADTSASATTWICRGLGPRPRSRWFAQQALNEASESEMIQHPGRGRGWGAGRGSGRGPRRG
jgi:hypothetical protein